MKLLTLLLALQVSAGQIIPTVSADGVHRFALSIPAREKPAELPLDQWLDNILAKELARARWCLQGWTISNTIEADGMVVVFGDCR